VVNRFEQFLLNTAAEAVAYVNEVGSTNLKILLDTYHMNIEEDSIAGAITTAGSLLGHLHIGENNRKLLATATSPGARSAGLFTRLAIRDGLSWSHSS
jgi:D-psicose/D-tagatose/L-ribulose 3-epimerase